MADKLAKALKSFYHGKEVKTRRSAPFSVSEQQFKQLAAKGLVAECNGEVSPLDPKPESQPQSASPAGLALQQTTAQQSEIGDKQNIPTDQNQQIPAGNSVAQMQKANRRHRSSKPEKNA